jgi:signal transduction histidine kinase
MTWAERSRREVPAAGATDKLSLLDSLPQFLEELARTLESPKSSEQADTNAEVACEHGEERASLQGYTLSQVIYEYQILRDCLVEFLDLESSLTSDARHILHSFIDRGIGKAAARFAELQELANLQLLGNLKTTQENLASDKYRLAQTVRDLEQERELRDRFVSALSHDLRTPLAAAKMTAQVLARKAPDQSGLKIMTDRIVQSMDRADSMIRDLLDANRLKAGEGIPVYCEQLRLDEWLEVVVHELNEMYGPRFQVQNQLGIVSGIWDKVAVRRIIENLSGNAIKYGKLNGSVLVKLIKSEHWVEFSVHNDGEPISLEDQKVLFDPYRRTSSAVKGEQGGWGIGLTLVKGLTEAQGGQVRVESHIDRGTTFSVRLPWNGNRIP